MLAEPETVLLDDAAASIALGAIPSLEAIVGEAARLNGASRAGGQVDHGWLEPPPGVPPTADTRVQVLISNERGGVALPMPAQVFKLEQGDLLRCVYYSLTLAIGVTTEHLIVRWWLEPGGDDATLRTDALDLLVALHQAGWLTVTDIPSGRRVGRTRIEPSEPLDLELRDAHQFLERVAILEEWSGRRIPVPEQVDAEQATEIARAEAIVLARQIPLRVGRELSVTVPSATSPHFDELWLPRSFAVTVLGVEVPLGDATLSVAVQPVGMEPAGSDRSRVHCVLAEGQLDQLLVHLEPPATRSRILRRTLVAGAPVPPRPELLAERIDLDRLELAKRFLGDLERELGPVPAELMAEIEAEWPA